MTDHRSNRFKRELGSFRHLAGEVLGRSRADKGILRVSAALLAVAVVGTGLASYTFLRDSLVRDRTTILDAELQRRSQQLSLPLRARIDLAGSLAARSHTAQAMLVLQDDKASVDDRTTAIWTLQATTGNLMRAGGLRAVELLSLENNRIAFAHFLPELPRLSVPLAGGRHMLYWDDGFFLRVSVDVVGERGVAGAMIADLRVTDADAAITGIDRLGDTGEAGLCGLSGARKVCFPSRFSPEGSIGKVASPARLPTDRALSGERGTAQVVDYRGRPTYSSFAMLDDLGLAMAVKVDEAELLAPIRRQTMLGLPALILLAAAGSLLVRAQLKPLTSALVSARQLADAEVASRASAEAEIRRANRRLQLIADNTSFLIAFLDTDFVFRFANRAHVEWFCRPLEQIVGQPMEALMGQHLAGEFRQAMTTARATGTPQSVFRESLREGESKFAEMTFVALVDEDGHFEGYCVTTRDATETVLREQMLLLAARRDPLTGLCNRTSFTERLEQALGSIDLDAEMLAVAYLDIDHFKRVNDNFGHDVGDALLRDFGLRIESALKHSDTVARLGGDEFALILPELASAADLRVISMRLLASLRDPFVIGSHRIQMSASIGFAVAVHGDSVSSLLDRADKELYEVKRNGRDGVSQAIGAGISELSA